MTGEERTEETEEEKKTSSLTILLLAVGAIVSAVVFLALVTVVVPQIFLAFVLMFEGSPDHYLTCDYDLTADAELRESWIKSNDINSYEDIPKEEIENLSNDTKESLKRYPSSWYSGIEYSDLSEKEKELFNGTRYGKSADLSSEEYNRYGDKFTNSVILYKGIKIYRCEIYTYRGA